MIADEQITRQIECATMVKAVLTDGPVHFQLTSQCWKHWISLAHVVSWAPVTFSRERRIAPELAEEMRSLFTGEQFYVTDPEVIRLGMDFSAFVGRYFSET